MSGRDREEVWTGRAAPASLGGRLHLVSLVVGLLVALAVVVPTLLSGAHEGQRLETPPFWYTADTVLASSAPGAYTYNVTVTSIVGGNASTAWTQLFSGPELLVALLTPAGGAVAEYNSSDSSFEPQLGYNATTFPDLGGWESGYGVPVLPGDIFEIHSAVSLTNYNIWLYMACTAPPHWFNGQTLLG